MMMRTIALMFAVQVLLAGAAPARGQALSPQWLTGRWDGTAGNNTIIFSVGPVSAEGTAAGRWGAAGQLRQPTKEIRANGDHVRVVNFRDVLIELERETDDKMNGHVVRQDGSRARVTLTKVTNLNLFDGEWHGPATPQAPRCIPGSYSFRVKDGLIEGTAEFSFPGQPVKTSTVIGDIRPDHSATLVLTSQVQDGRNSAFQGSFQKSEFKGSDAAPNFRCNYDVWLKRQ